MSIREAEPSRVEYWIEAQPTPAVFGANELGDTSREALRQVLFAYGFSIEDGPEDFDLIADVVRSAIPVGLGFLQSRNRRTSVAVNIAFNEPIVHEGSVEILLPVSQLSVEFAPVAQGILHMAAGTGLTGLMAYAADKITGGALSEVGKRITGESLDRLRRFRSPQGTGRVRRSEISDPEEQALREIHKLTAQHRCRRALMVEGAIRDGVWLRYKYILSECVSMAPYLTATVMVPRRPSGVPEVWVDELRSGLKNP